MGAKEEYEKKIESQLDKWNIEIEKLKARVDKAEAETKIKYYEKIEILRQKQNAAREKLELLKKAGESAWQDLKAGTEKAFNDLKEGIESALSKFK